MIERLQEQLGGQIPTSSGNVPFTVGEPTITGDEARVEVTIEFPRELTRITGQNEQTIPIIAVKEGGAWKVDIAKTEAGLRSGTGAGGPLPMPSR